MLFVSAYIINFSLLYSIQQTLFKGWLSPDDMGQRKDFIMEIKNEIIEEIAPVVLVRRRL